ILSVFRKVQSEERALAMELKSTERKKRIESMSIAGELPQTVLGGYPLNFKFRLKDPSASIEDCRIHYRRSEEPEISALTLSRGDDGTWKASLPGETMASPNGFTFEYFLETRDQEGPLLTHGSKTNPMLVQVFPGAVAQKPPPLSRLPFVLAASVTLAAGAT